MICPAKTRKNPQNRENSIAVCTAEEISFSSCFPISVAVTTPAPEVIPTKKFRSSETVEAFPPTAASAWLEANLPTTAVSAALKTC